MMIDTHQQRGSEAAVLNLFSGMKAKGFSENRYLGLLLADRRLLSSGSPNLCFSYWVLRLGPDAYAAAFIWKPLGTKPRLT